MKRRITRLLLFLMVACSTTTAHAAYIASKVTMTTAKDTKTMTFIGFADGAAQIWACPNDVTDATSASWQIDDGTSISVSTAAFTANKKYTLSTESYQDYARTLSADTQCYHFLKVTGNTSAEFFTWNMKDTPLFAKDFYLTGTVSGNVTDQYYGDNNESYIHTLAYSITNMAEAVFDHASIELSYDGGNTWTYYTTGLTLMSAKLPIMLPLDKKKVRYRITAYPKDCYKVVWNKAKWTYVTDDYDIYYTSRLTYKASSVIMNTGSGSGTDINMVQLGTTQGGCQIWACPGIDAHRYTNWKIDGGQKMSLEKDHFYTDTHYSLTTDYSTFDGNADVPEGSSIYHFIKVKGKTSADYFSWCGDKTFRANGYYLCPEFDFKTTSDVTIDKTDHCLKQGVEYALSNINGKALDSLLVMTSCDQGKTWQIVGGMKTGFTEEIKTFSNAETVCVSAENNTVRYKIAAYPKSVYKVIAENGCWTYETEDYPIAFPDLKFSIAAEMPGISTYAKDADTGAYTYDANVTWSVLSNMAELLDSVSLQCSTDDGNTWTPCGKSTEAEGTMTLKVPAGYAHYQFRAEPCLKGKLAATAIFHQYAVSETLTPVYNPEVSLTVSQTGSEEEFGNAFRTYKLSYALNDGLWQAHENASVAYSYDGGKSWHKFAAFEPSEQGEQTVTVDATKKQCKFRIKVKSNVQGAETYCTAETENISFE